MNVCPVDGDLVRFLNSETDETETNSFVSHLEGCRRCQERMEELTRFAISPLGDPVHDDWRFLWSSGDDRAATERQDEVGSSDSIGTESPTADFMAMNLGALEPGDLDDPDGSRRGTDPEPPAGASDPAGIVTVDRDPDRTDVLPGDGRPVIGERRRVKISRFPTVEGYEILEWLGEGGMGVVYEAKHRGLNRTVALKMIREIARGRSDALARFRIEAESVARLKHPNIIQIYDIGDADGLPFVALEFLDGGSLGDRLAGNPQPARAAAELTMTLAAAVQAAHDHGIIHRDLKPANVLYGSDGVPRVTDFGLAKRVGSDEGETRTGQVMGSPCYMAPEQARGDSRDVGPAADVYALGAILYEMLTGRPPFKGATPMETVRQVVENEPVPPASLVPRVPRDLETIALKCLAKPPARRYPSARALAEDLKRYLEGVPVRARRTPPWERAVKWIRRHPILAAAAAVFLLAVAGAIGGLFAYQNHQLERTREFSGFLAAVSTLEREADSARTPPELNDIKLRVSAFLSRLDARNDDPRLVELSDRLTRSLRQVEAEIQRIDSDQAAQARFQTFRGRRDEAVLRDTHFSGLGLPGDRTATRREALAALDLYASPSADGSWTRAELPAVLSLAQRTEIDEGCYELLLVLSQAESNPKDGLARLDQASRLRPEPTRAYHLRRAACLEQAGDRASAERERIEAERRPPATAFDHYLAGKERYERGQPIEAIRQFDQTLRLRPDHFWAQCLSAICWIQADRPEAARPGLTFCIARQPDFPWLHLLHGLAASRGPAGATAEELRLRFDTALADYAEAARLLERKPNRELQYILLVNRGLLRQRHGDLPSAAGDFSAAIALGDEGAIASAGLADVLREQGRLLEATEQFGRAIARRPDWAPLYRGRADVILAMGQPSPGLRATALADLDQAIRLETPDNLVLARDHANRGRLLAQAGDDARALAACDAAIARVATYEPAHRLRLDILLRQGRRDDVIRSCDALIERGKAAPSIYERRALAREELRDFSGAIEDFTSAMASGGDRPTLLRRRGWLYIVAEAPRLALRDFEEAIRQDPASGDAYNGRGAARVRLAEHREAVADASTALSQGTPTPDVYYKAARIYAVAAVVVAAEARKKGQESVRLVARYQDAASSLLGEAIRRMPPDRRSSFVRDVVLFDPDLRRICRRLNLAGRTEPAAGGRAPASR